MNEELIRQLQTPCIVIDLKKVEKNVSEMQEIADQNHCALRPHIKTHKMPLFAKMQIDAGASGITCAKVSEAEVMAAGGMKDIFIAYPLVGDFRIRRAAALQKKLDRLILAVDSKEQAQMLSNGAGKYGVEFEVRMEVDTGAKRTGVSREKAAELARFIGMLPALRLTGIYTFKSLVYRDSPTTDRETAGREEGEMMRDIAAAIRKSGITLTDISAGSTPTGEPVAKTGMVTEIRPGTYVFKDYMLFKEMVIPSLDEVAAHIYVTVVSTPDPSYAVIDGGSKTFPMDISLGAAPYFYPGYAVVEGNDDLCLTRLSEEHGMLASKSGNTGLRVGQVLKLIPIHVCPAVNLQNQVYLYDGETLAEQRVGARGMLV